MYLDGLSVRIVDADLVLPLRYGSDTGRGQRRMITFRHKFLGKLRRFRIHAQGRTFLWQHLSGSFQISWRAGAGACRRVGLLSRSVGSVVSVQVPVAGGRDRDSFFARGDIHVAEASADLLTVAGVHGFRFWRVLVLW